MLVRFSTSFLDDLENAMDNYVLSKQKIKAKKCSSSLCSGLNLNNTFGNKSITCSRRFTTMTKPAYQ